MTQLSQYCPLGFLSIAEEREYTPHLNVGKDGTPAEAERPFIADSE